MSKEIKKGAWILLAIGVLATFLMPQCTFIVNPGLNLLAEKFPEVSHSTILLVQTMVSATCIPFALVSGALMARGVRYRLLGCSAALFILIGGVAAFFVSENIYLILACRAVCGIGEGLAFPIGSALIIEYFQGRRRSLVQGASMFALNISGVIYQNVSGRLCLIDVDYMWLLHLCLIVPLVLMLLFLKEPGEETKAIARVGREEAEEENEEAGLTIDTSGLPKFSKRAFLFTLAFCVWTTFYFMVTLNMSQAIDVLGIGTPSDAGLAGSFYQVAGLTSGLIFPLAFRTLKKYLAPVALIIGFIGILCFTFASNIAMCCAANFCVGISAFIFWPNAMRDYAVMVNPAGVGLFSAIYSVLWNLGAVFSGYWVSFTMDITGSDNPRDYGIITVVAGAVLIVVWILIRMRRPKEFEADYNLK